MVKMKCDGQPRLRNSGLHQFHQISMIRIGACALGNLKNQRSIHLFCSLGDPLNDLHVINIERTDRITTAVSLFKHFLCCNQWHYFISLL